MSWTWSSQQGGDCMSQEMFRTVVEAAPAGMIVIDPHGRITLANPETLRIFGYAYDELLGQPIEVLVPQALRSGHVRLRDGYLSSPAMRPMGICRDLLGLRKDGSTVAVEVALNPVGSGTDMCVLATVTDITERKRADEGRARLAALVESSEDAIVGISPDGRITSWNSGATSIFWWSETDIIGRPIATIVPPELVEEETQVLAEVWAGHPVKHFDTLRMRRDGSRVPVSLTISPIRDGRGKIVGASKILRDVTERQRAEQALREANEMLEQRVAERTRELTEQMEARRNVEAALAQAQKMEAVGQLTGGVAHDFNNLLTVISGNLHFVAELGETNERLQRLASSIQRAVDRGAKLTGQLLAFARRQTLQPEVLRLDELIQDFSTLVQRAVGDLVRLEIQSDARLGACEVDPSQFESAVLNIAINARDAMPAGGRMTIEMRNYVHPGSGDLPAGKYIAVSLADTGCGMAPDVLAHAIEPFFTTKQVGKGSGLGLSQVYGFVQQSGGALRIESRQGEGTRITMLFPMAAATLASAEPAPTATAAPPKRPPVLVVEDDKDVLELMRETLTRAGHPVIGAHDGGEALAMLDRHPEVALVLSDIVMPNGTNGLELANEARRRRPDLPVMLMSGYPRDVLRGLGSTEKFPLLTKPFRPADLIERLEELLPAQG